MFELCVVYFYNKYVLRVYFVVFVLLICLDVVLPGMWGRIREVSNNPEFKLGLVLSVVSICLSV